MAWYTITYAYTAHSSTSGSRGPSQCVVHAPRCWYSLYALYHFSNDHSGSPVLPEYESGGCARPQQTRAPIRRACVYPCVASYNDRATAGVNFVRGPVHDYATECPLLCFYRVGFFAALALSSLLLWSFLSAPDTRLWLT